MDPGQDRNMSKRGPFFKNFPQIYTSFLFSGKNEERDENIAMLPTAKIENADNSLFIEGMCFAMTQYVLEL